jgi:hypothetical protein
MAVAARCLSLLLLLGAGVLAAPLRAEPALTQYAALRFCAHRLDGLSPEEAREAAIADLQSRYYALIGGQLPAIRAGLPAASRRTCPEAFPRQAGPAAAPPVRLQAVDPCTPTLGQTRRAASGARVTTGTGASCQIQIN